MACVSPEGLHPIAPSRFPADIPFSVALTSDAFDPWTETSHKFRLYMQPKFDTITPETINVGEITEVLVTINDPELGRLLAAQIEDENVFFEPLPSAASSINTSSDGMEGEFEPSLANFSMVKCSFGRFGETAAVIIDPHHLKCTTPSVPDDPADIYMEEIEFSITMNGFDYDLTSEGKRKFTFVGTGQPMGLLPIVIMILLFGVLIAAFVFCVQNSFDVHSMQDIV